MTAPLLGLCRHTNAERRTSDARKVDRSSVIQLRPNHRGLQTPCAFRIDIEVRADSIPYVKIISNKPRTS